MIKCLFAPGENHVIGKLEAVARKTTDFYMNCVIFSAPSDIPKSHLCSFNLHSRGPGSRWRRHSEEDYSP